MTVLDLFDLSGKTAIVTGGATGIGRQMADALAELGASVVLCGRNEARCVEAAAEMSGAHGMRCLGLRCDVTDPGEVEAMVAATLAAYGGIDVLVNNAGTAWAGPAETTPLRGWQKVVDVNLTGTFLFSQAAGRAMIEQGGGKIVNIASVLALTGTRPEIMNAIAYNATKGGILSFTRDLACKWAQHGIMVNAIAPGWFPSDMSNVVLEKHEAEMRESIPLRRFGGPDDLKGAVGFLASAASDYVTGQTLVVDGGQSAW